MADEEQLRILKQGSDAWNVWRCSQHGTPRIDLIGANLMGAPLMGADLSGANLTGANLSESDLRTAVLSGANLSGANLYKATLKPAFGAHRRTNLSGANLSGACLLGADLGWADFSGADLSEADLSYAKLSDAKLSDAKLSGTGADLSRANLREADLRRADLSGANLSEADLSEADLSEADLSEADLSGANLSEANLSWANLSWAKLPGANLGGANLRMANLYKADLRGADLLGAILIDATLNEADLSGADLTGSHVFGVSAWRLTLSQDTKQKSLVITPPGKPEITADDIEVAQFLYLLIHNEKLRKVIDTITSKVVLILGRFSEERKPVLDAMRDALRTRDLLPVIFDFSVPENRDVTETARVLFGLARFVIADITDATEVRSELNFVPDFPSLPVQPILLHGRPEPVGIPHWRKFPWFLPSFEYENMEHLLANLDDRVVAPAEAKVPKLQTPQP